ncbi:MAG: CHRD domain-containing protein [Rhodothermales bacterium]|nr:CHRD domain-containing protein [Rhodothermales bacterium]
MTRTLRLWLIAILFALSPALRDAHAQVIINEIGFDGVDFGEQPKWVELYNAGPAEADVSSYVLCNFPAYPALSSLTALSGSTTIPAGGFLVVAWERLDDAMGDGTPDGNGEVGLYTNSDFSNSDSMVDYLQWGTGGHFRESVAVGASEWTAGTFVAAPASGQSLSYVPTGDDFVGNWRVSAPTPGAANATLYRAMLSGGSQSPGVLSRGTGVIDAILEDTTLTVSGTFSGLETDFNVAVAGGAHLHNGLAGQGGGIAIGLTVTLDGDNRGGQFEAANNTFALTPEQVASLSARALYMNIHTLGNPGGELRGQMVSAAAETFKSVLSGSGQMPGNTSLGRGMIVAELEGTTLTVSGALSGLASDFNPNVAGGAHLHAGMAGQNGSIEVGLVATIGDDNRSVTFAAADNTFEIAPEQAEAIRLRGIYTNIHTVDLPSGELRGQMIDAGSTPFLAALSGASAEAANASAGKGSVIAELNDGSLHVHGSFSELRGAFNPNVAGGAHLHGGLAGQSGSIAYGLASVRATDELSGVFEAASNIFEVDDSAIDALFARGHYVNIHTQYQASGELRGQVIPAWSVPLRAVLSGRAQSSPNTSQATGGAMLEISGSKLTVTGAFNGLTSGFNENVAGGAHIHDGGLGTNGSIAIGLTATRTPDDLNGTFAAADNVFDITEEVRTNLLTLVNYVNVHTDTLPSGELRGQIHPLSYRPFEANLAFDNQVSSTPGKAHAHHGGSQSVADHSNASGAVLAVLGDTSLIVSGSFKDLSSALNVGIAGGAHLHAGAANANGSVDFVLTSALADDSLSGTFPAAENVLSITSEQKLALLDGLYYVNVHSRDHAPGELRGQLVPSGNVAPNNPVITAPADGATVVVVGDPDTPFEPAWNGGDRNANPVFYTWQLAVDEAFETLLVQAATEAPVFASTFGDVNTLLLDAGVELDQSTTLYHRAIATDGNFRVTGPAASVILTRGEVTSTDEPGALPEAFRLQGNFPNPFNPTTTVIFDLPAQAMVDVTIHDVLGRQVMHVPAQAFAPGANQAIRIDASELASGMYVYQVKAAVGNDITVSNGRMVLIK